MYEDASYIANYDDNGHIIFNHVLVSWYGISLSSRIHSGVFSNDM